MTELYIAGIIISVVAAVAARSALKVVWRRLIRPKIKGQKGEAKVSKVLKRFSKRGNRSRNDILIPHGRGTAQIDHLLITKQGILVLETKNYSGVVRGTEKERMWTQFFPNSTKSNRQFYNPIQQNEGHIHALRELLKDFGHVPMKSLVVFTGNCSFPELPGVIHHSALKHMIKYMSSGTEVLTSDQVKKIASLIDEKSITSTDARQKHNFQAQISSHVSPEQTQALIDRSIANGVYISTAAPPERKATPTEMKRQYLCDTHAILTIKGQKDSIDGFFEKAKRRNDGQAVPVGGNFDYFICPYTGDRFPEAEALNLYQGLWISYLNKHPDLVDFMKSQGPENLGNSFRCKKVLTAYCADKEGFTAQIKQTPWYRNMLSRYQVKPAADTSKKPTLDHQINAGQERSRPKPASHSNVHSSSLIER